MIGKLNPSLRISQEELNAIQGASDRFDALLAEALSLTGKMTTEIDAILTEPETTEEGLENGDR